MIGVDWGTSSLRAYRIGADGRALERRSVPLGIVAVTNGNFAAVLEHEIRPWLSQGETRVLLCGMIGSRQGWREASYVPCPAGAADLAAALVDVPFDWAQVKLVPGLSAVDPDGVPEVMRGEETQIVGVPTALGAAGIACLPGTHSKWASIANGRVAHFRTFLTGETFAALRDHTILGRMMRGEATDAAAFDRGLARARADGGLLHHLFGVRTLGLFGQLAEEAAASYLSALLIGHEIQAALPQRAYVHLIGATGLCMLYARAIEQAGGRAIIEDEDAAARGLALIGGLAQWT
jgi:2-dehydro-3-deoxygalactonokinase